MKGTEFRDACVSSDGCVFTYRTGMTVYEERFVRGRLVSAGWSGGGFSQGILENQPTWLPEGELNRSMAFSVDINGMSQPDTWKCGGFSSRSETLENGTEIIRCILELKNTQFPLRVRILTLLDGTAVFERKIEWINDGSQPLFLSRMTLLGGVLEKTETEGTDYALNPEHLYSLGYFDSADWAREGLFRRRDLLPDETSFSGRFRRSRHRHPMFLLNNRLTGSVFFAQLAYSGGYTMRFDYHPSDRSAELSYGIELDGEQPLLILQPGEIFETPGVHIGRMNASDDEMIQQMHTHIRKSVFTLPEAGNGVRGGLIEFGVGPEHPMDFLFEAVDQAAQAGAEAFLIDAGWYCPPEKEGEWRERTGDWRPDVQRFPEGLKPIRDYIRSRGLLFGLWVDPERIGPLSRVAEAHPDWLAKPYGGQSSSRIDLTNPEALCWVEGELKRIFTEYQVDVFRLDYNISTYEISSPTDDREDSSLRYFAAVCGMYERLRRKFPDTVFENCAGGGGRTDLGFIKYFTHTWVSDWQTSPRGLAITNGMTMALPPERVDRLFAGMGSHISGSFDFILQSTLFGRPTMNLISSSQMGANPLQMERVQHAFNLFRTYVRPYAENGKIWHHTPECYGKTPGGRLLLERASEDGCVGIYGIFALDGSAAGAVTVYPQGVVRNREYEVRFDHSGERVLLSGQEILQNGLRVTLSSALTNELILYRVIRSDAECSGNFTEMP